LYRAEYLLLVGQFKHRYRDLAENADDVVQDAFHRLWTNFGPGAARQGELALADAGKWVNRVAANAMIDLARSRRSRPMSPLNEEATEAPEAFRSAAGDSTEAFHASDEDAAHAAEMDIERRRAALLYALEQLPANQKTVLIELYINGKSYDEIARSTGYARGALGTTLLRARRTALALAQEYLNAEHQPPIRHR
jgi:RNA polymerase sigma factor (sigma-70 family)